MATDHRVSFSRFNQIRSYIFIFESINYVLNLRRTKQVAVKNGMPPLVYHLLELGAVVNVMTKSDETPLSIAMNLEDGSPLKKEAKLMITQMLKSYGALGSCKEIMTRIRAGTLSVQPRKAAAVTSAESIPEGRRLPEEDDK